MGSPRLSKSSSHSRIVFQPDAAVDSSRSLESTDGGEGAVRMSGVTAEALSDQELVAELQRRNLINA
jgi:hypothetical protein